MLPSDILKVEIAHYTARGYDLSLKGVHVALSDFSKSPRSEPSRLAALCSLQSRRVINWPQSFARRKVPMEAYQLVATTILDDEEGEEYAFSRIPEFDGSSATLHLDQCFRWIRERGSAAALQGDVLTFQSTEQMFTGVMDGMSEMFLLPAAYKIALHATSFTNSFEELEVMKQWLNVGLKKMFVRRFETVWDPFTSFVHFNWHAD
jgi:hypothetical protein